MKYEDIENEDVKSCVQAFYVYQAVLIRTPLGTFGVDNKPTYPVYFKRCNNEIDKLKGELLNLNIETKKATLPEESSSLSSTSFLEEYTRQQMLQLLLVQNKQVIEPPTGLDLMVINFTERLRTPWY